MDHSFRAQRCAAALTACLALQYLAAVAGQLQDPVPISAGTAIRTADNVILGRAADQVTGLPVPNVRLYLVPFQRVAEGYAAVTGADGRFAFLRVAEGRFRIMVEGAGYGMAPARITAGGTARGEVDVVHGQPIPELEVVLRPESRITGRVMTEFGEPVHGARVHCLRRTFVKGVERLLPAGQATTMSSGAYVISGLQPGGYYIYAIPPIPDEAPAVPPSGMTQDASMRAPKEGLYTTLYPKAEAIESAALVSVTEGMSVERMDVMLRIGPVYTLAGSLEVGDAGDGPYRVELHEMPSGSSLPVVRSQLQARASPFQFHFRGLKSGQYLLLARSAASPDQIAGSGIVVIQRTDINGWRMELGRGRRVRGRVVPPDLLGADRRPAWAGGVLTLLNTGLADTPAARITVNGAGEFSIDRLAPDRMLVEVAGASPENYVKDFRVAGRSVPEMVLDLRQSEEAFAEVVLAGPAAEISGELVKEDGTRIGGGFVVIRSTDEGVRIQNIVRCNSRGEYQITRLRPGDYDLFGWSQPKGGPLDDPDLLNNNSVRASRVKIEAGAILRKRLVAIH